LRLGENEKMSSGGRQFLEEFEQPSPIIRRGGNSQEVLETHHL
jgi:hypothetical protein